MRCASCGTQNEPDSRFCGGCGARLSAGESRLAPTQKVTGGAHEVQARVQAMTPAPQPVVTTTPAPGAAMAPGIPTTPIPATPLPSMSMLDTLPPRMSGQQVARGPSGQQGVAPFGSEPPRITSSVRGVPVPGPGGIPGTGGGGGPGGIPGTSGTPAPTRPVALPSAPTPRSRMGLIIGVLVVDLALALAGGWLLSRGLSTSDAPPPPPPAPPPRAAPPSPS